MPRGAKRGMLQAVGLGVGAHSRGQFVHAWNWVTYKQVFATEPGGKRTPCLVSGDALACCLRACNFMRCRSGGCELFTHETFQFWWTPLWRT